jgi:DNA-binding IclR family transcriptional regulator
MDKTVAKAFALLEELAQSDRPLGVSELSERLGLGKSNVHRLLQTLISLKYARQTPDSSYVASLRMWEMGHQIFSNFSFRDIVKPYMRRLAELTNETVHLSEMDGFEVVYVDKIESKEPVRTYTQLGGRAPAYCVATGKIQMAYLPEEDIRRCYETVNQFTPHTITDVEAFCRQAAENRERGYAVNRGEWRSDVIGLAAPIADSSGDVVAAIGLSAPASRVDVKKMERYAETVTGFARDISQELGCPRSFFLTQQAHNETGGASQSL